MYPADSAPLRSDGPGRGIRAGPLGSGNTDHRQSGKKSGAFLSGRPIAITLDNDDSCKRNHQEERVGGEEHRAHHGAATDGALETAAQAEVKTIAVRSRRSRSEPLSPMVGLERAPLDSCELPKRSKHKSQRGSSATKTRNSSIAREPAQLE